MSSLSLVVSDWVAPQPYNLVEPGPFCDLINSSKLFAIVLRICRRLY